MKGFNLTEWSLRHRSIVAFFVVLTVCAGVYSYQNLARMEEPEFVIREMVITVAWPGATASQVEEQVTDKIERKIQDTAGLDYVKSCSMAGQAVIYVYLKEQVKVKDVRPTFVEIRNAVGDIKMSLPQGVIGPFYNDHFDDVFGSVYALTSDGYSYEELRTKAEKIRRMLMDVKNVRKVELVGVQPERIYVEMDSSKLAGYAIDPMLVIGALNAQNAMNSAGMLATSSDNVHLRVTGVFDNLEDIRRLPIRALDKTFKLGDIAVVERAYADPPEPQMFYNGRPAIGICVSMEKGGNILKLGRSLESTLARIERELPLGFEIDQVADQPRAVKESINQFIKTLFEAIAIVMLVSFVTLGLRTGVVVALCIPLVVAGTLAGMHLTGIPMHNVSMGSLIMALGLLVDDAIIAVEMMTVKLEQGWDRFKAACHAYTVTAFPMLTGTLITCAGFIPIGFSKGSASEYCNSIFWVLLMSLVLSWFVSVMIAPLLGYRLISVKAAGAHQQDIYASPFYARFRRLLLYCLRHRRAVLLLTLALFGLAVFGFNFLKQEFFPESRRPELIVDLTLPEGSSLTATRQTAARFASRLETEPGIDHYTYYVGSGAPRFALDYEPPLERPNFAQFVVVAKGVEERAVLRRRFEQIFASGFAAVRAHVTVMQMSPPEPYPVMIRVAGFERAKLRELAEQVGAVMAADPRLRDVNYNWHEKTRSLVLKVDQDKARALGIDSATLAANLQAQVSGVAVSEFREADRTIPIVFRLDARDRKQLVDIKNLNIPLGTGRSVPLEQIAEISYAAEDGSIWRRDLKPTITVQAETVPGVTGNDAVKQVYRDLAAIRSKLPIGYTIEIGGSPESSVTSTKLLLEPVPLMIVVIMILLIFQLKSSSRMFLTILTAPLGIIGVVVALMLSGLPMGFMPESGILALFGIIIRNSVILIDQIERQRETGETPFNAIVNAAVMRFRPIMLTAAAAILGMVPLIFDNFWRGLAVTIASGLFGATILTLLVLPAMYAAWFKVEPESDQV